MLHRCSVVVPLLLLAPVLAAQQLENHDSTGTVNVGAATVDVSMLRAPRKAIKEFQRADELLDQQQWAKAVEHLRKAVEVDPEFVEAYNNLGVAYARLGDSEHEREALDKAIAVNPHTAQPLLNRARMALREHDMAGAEGFLARAADADAKNEDTLTLLAKVQLQNEHFEAALASAQRVDSLPHQQYAVIHYLAARALKGEHRPVDAASQLRLFLQEQPQGSQADAARRELLELVGADGAPDYDAGLR